MLTILRTVASRIAALFTACRAARRLDEELQSHLDLLVEQNLSRGMSPEEARRAARLSLGGADQIKQSVRDHRGFPFLDSLAQDVRFATRTLRKSPAFTIVAILTLALGIGANTAIFSVAYAVLLRPLPYPHSSQLVSLTEGRTFKTGGTIGRSTGPPSFAAAQVVEQQHQIFSDSALYQWEQFILKGATAPTYIGGTSVAGNFFSLLSIQPLLGRPILPQDSQTGREHVAVISYRVWQDLFSGDARIIGRRIVLSDTPYTIVGVMPPRFNFPNDFSGNAVLQGIWTPWQPPLPKPGAQAPSISVVARLKPGETLEAANAQLHALATQLVATHAYDSEHLTDLLVWQRHGKIDWSNPPSLLILLAAVGFVLLIACVNVSALLLARSWSRRGEVAIRTALGATRARLVRQLLTESLLLSLAGGIGGLLFSLWGVRTIRLIAPPGTARMDQVGTGAAVLWFTLAVAIVAGLLFGLIPAIYASAHRLAAGLKQNRPGAAVASSERQPRRIRNVLVVIEIALAVVLVTGAALMARSLEKLAALPLGVRTDHIVTMYVNFSKSICLFAKQPSQGCVAAVHETLAHIQAMPGVQSAAISGRTPLDSAIAFSFRNTLRINDRVVPHEYDMADVDVSQAYFRTMGIHLLAGRTFSDGDTKDSSSVVIVNKKFVDLYMSGNPVGQRVSILEDKNGAPEWMNVIGVADDSRDDYLYSEPGPTFYRPFTQEFMGSTLLVRTTVDPIVLLPSIKQRIWSVDKDAPITQIRTMKQVISDMEADPHFHMVLLGSFGALGLLLAMIGAYGVISYTVAQRTHEIGVRIAIGAESRDVLLLVLREGMLLAGIGIAVGLAGSFALTRLIAGFLFEVKPTDPISFIAVPILLIAAALLACYIPARRATRVDPLTALRHE